MNKYFSFNFFFKKKHISCIHRNIYSFYNLHCDINMLKYFQKTFFLKTALNSKFFVWSSKKDSGKIFLKHLYINVVQFKHTATFFRDMLIKGTQMDTEIHIPTDKNRICLYSLSLKICKFHQNLTFASSTPKQHIHYQVRENKSVLIYIYFLIFLRCCYNKIKHLFSKNILSPV